MRLIVALSGFITIIALAQEPELPKPDPAGGGTTSPSPTAPAASPALEIIPAEVLTAAERAAAANLPIPNIPAITQFDEAFKQNSAGAAADDARRHAECRLLQNRIANDRDLKASLQFAEAARTDLEKRQRLQKYYELYFGKMIALATTPELKAYLIARKNGQLAALPQPRVRPPSPSPSPKG